MVMVILTMMNFVLYVILRFSSYSHCSPEGGNLAAEEDYGVEGCPEYSTVLEYLYRYILYDSYGG